MPIGIVTDSTCDLPDEIVQENGIRVVPLYIHIGTTDYLDGIDISREQFYQGLAGYHQPPTTAAPGIDTFAQVYEELAQEGATGIVSIHISETLSNVVNVAQLAAQKVTTVPVTVIDSGQLTLGVGFEAVRAAETARAGGTSTTVAGRTTARRSSTRRTRTTVISTCSRSSNRLRGEEQPSGHRSRASRSSVGEVEDATMVQAGRTARVTNSTQILL